jgi:hypothetical protein
MKTKNYAPPGGLEPPTFRLTAERASQLRHGGSCEMYSFSQQLCIRACHCSTMKAWTQHTQYPLWSSG